MFKKIGMGCAAILFAGAAFFGWMYYSTTPVRSAAHEFTAFVSGGKLDEAYAATSSAFKSVGSIEDFKEFIENNKLNQATDVSYRGWQINSSGEASLDGTFEADGVETPLHLGFIKEGEFWKIESIKVGVEEADDSSNADGDAARSEDSAIETQEPLEATEDNESREAAEPATPQAE